MTGFDKSPWRACRSGKYWAVIWGTEGVVARGLEEDVCRYLTNLHNLSLLKPTVERKTLDDSCSHPMDNRSADGLRCLQCGVLLP